MIMSCIKSECMKIFSLKKYKVIIAVTLLLNIFGVLIGKLPKSIISISMKNYPFTIISVCAYVVIPFMAFMLASSLISGECEKNQMKLLVTRHIERSNILIGKLGAIFIYLSALLAANTFVAVVLSTISSGLNSFSLIKVIMSFIITLLPILTIVSFAGFISVLCKGSSSALGLSIVSYGGFVLIKLILSGLGSIIFAGYLAIFKMVIGNTVPIFGFICGIVVLLCWVIIFIFAASLKFERKEF